MKRIENIYDVTQRLCGMIDPQGESNIDDVRYENLKQTIEVAERLINDIVRVAENRNRTESSMKKLGLEADEFINQLKEQLSYY